MIKKEHVDILEWFLLWVGVVLSLLGFSGIVMSITIYNSHSPDVMQIGLGIINIYLLILGLFLIFYRKKILIKE